MYQYYDTSKCKILFLILITSRTFIWISIKVLQNIYITAATVGNMACGGVKSNEAGKISWEAYQSEFCFLFLDTCK